MSLLNKMLCHAHLLACDDLSSKQRLLGCRRRRQCWRLRCGRGHGDSLDHLCSKRSQRSLGLTGSKHANGSIRCSARVRREYGGSSWDWPLVAQAAESWRSCRFTMRSPRSISHLTTDQAIKQH